MTPTQKPATRAALGHLTQLDGVRFLAVALVLVDHWTAERLPAAITFPLGSLGVTIFFVLSGFLISRILLAGKDKLPEPKTNSLGGYLKTFYIRRTLRIFPIYYLTLFLLYLLNEPPVRRTIGWLALYASNIYIAKYATWMGTVDHLWSLAVEEQVYLFMPLLLFLIPRSWVMPTALLMLVGSIALRYGLLLHGKPWFIGYVSMPTCLDSFGLGLAMAWLWLYHKERFESLFNSSVGLLGSIALFALVVWASKSYAAAHPQVDHTFNVYTHVWERLTASLIGFFLIGKAIIGFKGPMKTVLEHPASQYLGQISYGLYLYHNFIYNAYHTPPTHIVLRTWGKITSWVPVFGSSFAFQFVYILALTIGLASVSWYLIEKPVNKLKDRFAY
ncbi:acyltransferase family protein [Fibrivirga algicola]|uniref:Acyltransferase n=1 Tax=Fibrivirga algicola TaxID=2950420 RepID=A0ABX0QMN1_9BACT|nr:acyltransferase [Fibrivirga algicola]NID12420.1 acyltransferase [Fibrivirga algicola]